MEPDPVTASGSHYTGHLAKFVQKYRGLGIDEARENRPPSNAFGLDSNEQEIHLRAQEATGVESTIFEHSLEYISDKAGKVQDDLRAQANTIRQLLSDDSLEGKTLKIHADARKELVQATQGRLKAEAEYRHFRETNDIKEEPSYPASKYWHVGVVSILALFETVLNAFFYENAQGLLGGWVVALGVSAVNMVASFLLGFHCRHKNLKDPVWRFSGWLAGAGFFVLTVYCNALFAAYRSEYQQLSDPSRSADLARSFRTAVESAGGIFVLHLPFSDLTSFILFGLGLVLTCIAFYEGYTFDDRFPGHGAKHRAFKAQELIEGEMQKEVKTRLVKLTNDAIASVQEAIAAPAKLLERIGGCAGDLNRARSTLLAHLKIIQRDFALVLNAYRAANLAVRTTPAPRHFEETPSLSAQADDNAAAPFSTLIADVERAIDALRDANEEKLNSRRNDLHKLSSQILTTDFDRYLAEVTQLAHQAIDAESQRPPPAEGKA